MKAKIIIWGWVASFILLFAGIGTVESYEFGSREESLGWMLCVPWVVFSLLLVSNEKECLEEIDRIGNWFDHFLDED